MSTQGFPNAEVPLCEQAEEGSCGQFQASSASLLSVGCTSQGYRLLSLLCPSSSERQSPVKGHKADMGFSRLEGNIYPRFLQDLESRAPR